MEGKEKKDEVLMTTKFGDKKISPISFFHFIFILFLLESKYNIFASQMSCCNKNILEMKFNTKFSTFTSGSFNLYNPVSTKAFF